MASLPNSDLLDDSRVFVVAPVVFCRLLQRVEVQVLQERRDTGLTSRLSTSQDIRDGALTLLPQISSSISSGLNRYLSGDSLVTMWKPRLNALNCFSTLLFKMYSEYCVTNSCGDTAGTPSLPVQHVETFIPFIQFHCFLLVRLTKC